MREWFRWRHDGYFVNIFWDGAIHGNNCVVSFELIWRGWRYVGGVGSHGKWVRV